MKIADLASQPEAVRGQPATLLVGGAWQARLPVLHWTRPRPSPPPPHICPLNPRSRYAARIVLQESGDDYLVLPTPVVPDGSGGYLVADAGPPGVFQYSGNGRLMRRYGRAGEGPGEWGEWMDTNVTLPWGDEHVMVVSFTPSAIHLFRRSDGQFVERHPLNTPAESVVPGSEGLWLSGALYATRSAIRRLTVGNSEARPVLGLPDEYSANGPAGGIFHEMPFAMWADTLRWSGSSRFRI